MTITLLNHLDRGRHMLVLRCSLHSFYLFCGTNMLWICLQWILAAGRPSTGKGHRRLLLFATATNSMNMKCRIWMIFEPLKAFHGKWSYRIHTHHQEVSFSYCLSWFQQIQPSGKPLDICLRIFVWPAQTSHENICFFVLRRWFSHFIYYLLFDIFVLKVNFMQWQYKITFFMKQRLKYQDFKN